MENNVQNNLSNRDIPIVTQKDIFRLSALLYSETASTFSNMDVQLHIAECIIAQHSNIPMSINEIISNILTSYKFNLTEEEMTETISKSMVFETINVENNKKYKLLQSEYERINTILSKSIEYYINQFIDISLLSENDAILCRDSIYQYLYELTTTNINSYKILFSMPNKGNLTDSELSVNVYDLDDKGREYVCNFLKWESAEKNIAISNIVFCCLEYCLLISGDKPSLLVTEIIRDRKVFIDTNIIFRALGINGHSRKNVILAFLRKCKQAKIEISVSDITKSEFWTTIDYYITQIMAFPRGKIYWNVLEDISDYNLYSFYDLWHYNHEFLSLNYFRAYLNSIYADFIKEFKIQEVSIQTQSDESINSTGSFEIYARDISECKKNLKSKYISEDHWISSNDRHDSTMIKYLELYRAKQSNAIDVFFVSSDKALRYWDMTREKTGYPVVVYPSQLFLILIKLCGRSEDDLESFVSFINIRPSSQQLSNEKANVILAGISSITEDIIAQKSIVAAVLNDNFQNIIKHSNTDQELYQNAQLFSQKYLEDELKSKEKTIQIIQNKQDKALAEVAKLTSSNQEKEKILRSEAREKESYKNVVCKLAEEKIIWGYCFRWYLVPILLVVYFILFLSFITFQFIYCDASWNFVNEILLYLDATTFGKRVSDYIYIIDSVLLALTTALYKFCWKNPFDHKQQEIDKALRIEKYLEKFFPERKDNEIED